MGTCHMHDPAEPVPDDELLDHMRLVHPDQWERVQRWPDGDIVLYDATLEPGDFSGGSNG